MTNGFARTLKPALLAVSAVALMGLGSAARADEYVREETRVVQPKALDHAVRMIEQDTRGRVLEIRQSERTPGEFVAVVSVRGSAPQFVRLDTANALTHLSGDMIPSWTDRYASPAKARDARRARFDMSDAIAQAARDSDSVPLDAHFTEKGTIMAYDVHVSGPLHDVVIDANTGQRIASARDFEG